jgi:hypothetical protein
MISITLLADHLAPDFSAVLASQVSVPRVIDTPHSRGGMSVVFMFMLFFSTTSREVNQ